MKKSLLILFCLFYFTNNLYGTEQIPDLLINGKDTICLKSFPLEKLNFKVDPFSYGEYSFPHTACWRGYQAIWSIENDSLYLLDIIKIDSTKQKINLKKYFELNVYQAIIIKGKVFADWYSANLETYDFSYANYGNNCLFESYKPKKRKKKLEFSNGIIICDKLNDSLNVTKQNDKESVNNNAVGGNIFLGYGYLVGNISDYVSNPIFIGINVEYHIRKLVLQYDGYLGFGKVNETMEFPNDLKWSKNKFVLHTTGRANFGYSLIVNKYFKFVPISGIGFNSLRSTFFVSTDKLDIEPIIPIYNLGCYIDIKSLRLFKNDTSFNFMDSYTCIRLSLGLISPIGRQRYDEFYNGRMIYFTIGMSGFAS
jgi:hypothetical protein